MTKAMGSSSARVSREAFIAGMRDVSSSVTVVTTNGPAGQLGATVSAFCSVSADPPTVLICLRADSRIVEAVQQNGRYCVNVVPEGSEFLGNRFAGVEDSRIGDRFEEIDFSLSSQGNPILSGSTAFCCRLASVVPQASHLVLFGLVEEIKVTGATPQTYLAGAYRTLVPQENRVSV